MVKAKRRRRRLGRKARNRKDLGTPEARTHRRALIGDADPTLAGYQLGILLARGVITHQQHDAGCHYAYLCGRVLGRTKPVSLAESVGGAELSDAAMEDITHRWRQAVTVLFVAGRRSKDAVDNAAAYERLPGWTLRHRPRGSDAADAAALVDGLESLVSWRLGRIRAPVLWAAE